MSVRARRAPAANSSSTSRRASTASPSSGVGRDLLPAARLEVSELLAAEEMLLLESTHNEGSREDSIAGLGLHLIRLRAVDGGRRSNGRRTTPRGWRAPDPAAGQGRRTMSTVLPDPARHMAVPRSTTTT